ncbi:MAG: UDP-2,3-diacylglucosamine diphosphatase [Bacteroidota bacterium]|nr:UDP-2,3-diacylglucosamine hydrolase [Odoribacter sp.]MDP3643464.1 UDP-2,3-diacylglucosamine diphosphatase [Bacteroidota bacterium]
MQEAIRKLDISVISDVHLATLASKAKHLLKYLKSIQPKTLVLNGDIIDSWRFSRNFFPKAHLKVIRQLVKMIEKGIQVVYITGNHDDVFRKFNNTRLGNFSIVNQLELTVGNQKVWIFHGDVFDHIIHHSPWLAKFGAAAYGLLTGINKALNVILRIFGGKDMLLYKSMKDRILKEKKVLTNFELAIANAALSKNIDLVICGHTHIPVDKTTTTEKGTVRYINCGDWVEHFSAAECIDGNWTLNYFKSDSDEEPELPGDELYIPDKNQMYRSILKEMKVPYYF